MSFNPGPIIASTTAAITHEQRMNRIKSGETNSTYNPNRTMVDYQQISSPKEILDELKYILEQEQNKDENSISVYNVINLMREKYDECKCLDKNLLNHIRYLTAKNELFLDIDFDCENRQLITSYHCNKTYFTKKNNDLIIVKSEEYNATDLLCKCGDEISKRYDKFIEDISFYQDYINNIKSTNSNFIINSDRYGLDVKYSNFFELSARIYPNIYKYNCNSNSIATVCRDKEDEILKKIFIKINDCPKWAQEILYELRKEQIEQIEKMEYKKMKKQKRLELAKKLNPFRKK